MRLKAWSLNYRDLMVVKGQYNPKLRFPFTPLSDGGGEVAAVGDGVTRVKAGDRVAGCFMPGWIDGRGRPSSKAKVGAGRRPAGHARRAGRRCTRTASCRFRAHLSDDEGGDAALRRRDRLERPGFIAAASRRATRVLVQGTGGVSLFALQFARLHGAGSSPPRAASDKLARVLKLGASDGINYKDTPEWDDKVRELTGGVGVDHVVEVGGAGTLGKSLKAVRTGGAISLIGVLAGRGQVNPLPILMKNVRVQGIFVGSRAMFEAMNRAIALHQLRPVVDKAFAFGEVPAALRHMESAAHFGKICVREVSHLRLAA